ncbi:hypothetical protein LTS15_011141 [Exophiala xenobiotica]|nr:hypothetical protein LTS15_011141 [Exophiala xenobiotica]
MSLRIYLAKLNNGLEQRLEQRIERIENQNTTIVKELNNANTISLEQRIGRIEARTEITLGGTLACTVPVSALSEEHFLHSEYNFSILRKRLPVWDSLRDQRFSSGLTAPIRQSGRTDGEG